MAFPEFEAIIENATLKPTIRALDRLVDAAVFEVDRDGFDVTVADPANVALVDVDAPASAFESYSVDREGEVGLNVDQFADIVGDIGKRELVEVRGGNGELVIEELNGAVTGTVEYLEPDDLRDEPDVPPLEWSAEVEVPGDQFSRIIRVSRDISDHVGIGIGEADPESRRSDLVFKTWAEGDVDDVLGYPEHDFVGIGAPTEPMSSLYSGDYLRTLRLMLDRPATTTMRFRIAGDDFPLEASFSVGGDRMVDFTYIISPRIGGDQRGVAFPKWEVDSPALGTVGWRADMDGERGRRMFDIMGSFVDEYRLLVNDLGFESRAVDPSNVGLSGVEVQPDYFDSFTEEAGFPDRPIGVGHNRIEDLLKKWRKTDDMVFAGNSETRMISLQHDIFTVRLATIDPDSIREEPDFPKLALSGEVDTDPETVVDGIERAASVSDEMLILLSETRAYIAALGEDDGVFTELGQDVRGRAASFISADFAEKVADAMPVDAADVASIRTGAEFPVTFSVDTGSLEAIWLIAPRIGTDEEGVKSAGEIQSLLADEPVDLSWLDTGETNGVGVDPFEGTGIERTSIAERQRERRLSTFPIESKVVTRGTSGDRLVHEEESSGGIGRSFSSDNVYIDLVDSEDMAVPESTIEEVLDQVEETLPFDVLDTGETVARVTFEDEQRFDLDFVNIQPSTTTAINAEDGHRFRRLKKEDDNILYTSERGRTPAQRQVAVRAAEDPTRDGFSVFVELKDLAEGAPGPEEGTAISTGHQTIAGAYQALVGYIENTTIKGAVQQAGGTITLSLKELTEEIEAVLDPFIQYRLNEKPAGVDPSQANFIAGISGNGPVLPDATYTGKVSVTNPRADSSFDEIPDDGFAVRYSLEISSVSPPGTFSSKRQTLLSGNVGVAATRDEIPELVGEAMERIRAVDPIYAPQSDAERLDRPSARTDRGEIDEWVQWYLPASKEELMDEIEQSGFDIGIQLTDVPQVGSTRAEKLEPFGVQDTLDLTALLVSVGDFPQFGGEFVELAEPAREELERTVGLIWTEFIWPKREIPGTPEAVETEPDRDREPEPEPEPDTEGIVDFEIPDRVEQERWDFGVFRTDSDEFDERYVAVPFAEDVRRNPDVLVTEDVEDEAIRAARDYPAWFWRTGDLVSLVGVDDAVREPARIRAQSFEPAERLLEQRTHENGTLAVTADDGWTPINARALLDLDPGDIVDGFITAPIIEQTNRGPLVGWDEQRKFVFQPDTNGDIFIWRWNDDAEEIEPRGDDGYVAVDKGVATFREPVADVIIGFEPRSDEGFGPKEEILLSSLPDNKEIKPDLRSREDLQELVESDRDVWVRTSGGFVHRTEFSNMDPRAACAFVPDRVIPDGKFCVPAAGDESNIGLIAVETEEAVGEETDKPQFPVERSVTVSGRPEDRQVQLDGPVPEPTLQQFPDEKASDDPMGAFLLELSDVVSRTLRRELDEVESGTVIGTVVFMENGRWSFEQTTDIPEAEPEPPEPPEEPLQEPPEPEPVEPVERPEPDPVDDEPDDDEEPQFLGTLIAEPRVVLKGGERAVQAEVPDTDVDLDETVREEIRRAVRREIDIERVPLGESLGEVRVRVDGVRDTNLNRGRELMRSEEEREAQERAQEFIDILEDGQ